ncbi:MAG: protein kinase domain-containing protein [Acinetobacter sp.]|uniref:protein kinase domain-containing protein n=1 Tax=Acinetobacter sp. TaxID=472 RepID=UPI003D04B68F
MPSLLQFNPQDLQQYVLNLKAKPQSLVFGRRQYQFQVDDQLYWLKTQVQGPSQAHSASFAHELNVYRQLEIASEKNRVVLPFQMFEQNQLNLKGEAVSDVLILPHAQGWFETPVNTFTLPQIKKILWQAIDAVEQLWRQAWIHADLKREHFVVWQGQCKLIDFEQALPLESSLASSLTATPRYMAPELFHGQAKSLQSEIYALGIIFLEWLTAERLHAKSYEDWAYLHCQRLKVELPNQYLAFKDLVTGMLSKQKEPRLVDFYHLKSCLMTEFV